MAESKLFSVRATLAISAVSERSAHRIASDALRSIADVPGVEHAAIDVRCGLFDVAAFQQIPGQLAIPDAGEKTGSSAKPTAGRILDVLANLGSDVDVEDDRS